MADPHLVNAIKSGDADAFRKFFDDCHKGAFAYARKMGVPSEDAEDIVQQAFVSIWNRRESMDENHGLKSYLFRTVHNRALNFFRDRKKFVDDPTPDHASKEETVDSHDAKLLRKQMQSVVAQLPERRRAVFELCFTQGLTYKEAGIALGISPRTVEHQMASALRTLRQKLSHFRVNKASNE